MVEDLIGRLRAFAKDQGYWHNIDDICELAADEIEKGDRLIADLRHERNVLQKICAERDAEIERLSAALRKIADGPRDAELSYLALFFELKSEARAALIRTYTGAHQ